MQTSFKEIYTYVCLFVYTVTHYPLVVGICDENSLANDSNFLWELLCEIVTKKYATQSDVFICQIPRNGGILKGMCRIYSCPSEEFLNFPLPRTFTCILPSLSALSQITGFKGRFPSRGMQVINAILRKIQICAFSFEVFRGI